MKSKFQVSLTQKEKSASNSSVGENQGGMEGMHLLKNATWPQLTIHH